MAALDVAEEQPDGFFQMVYIFWAAVMGWTGLFYVFLALEPWFMRTFSKSSKEHENERCWIAKALSSFAHACVVSPMTVPAVFILWNAPDEIKYGHSKHLAWCRVEPLDGMEQYVFIWQTVAFAGLLFTAWVTSDLIVSILHGVTTPDQIVHHCSFILAGLIIRQHCFIPFCAAILLAMEVSSPFLNIMLVFRHRGDEYGNLVKVSGVFFVIFFFVFRLLLNTYGAILLVVHAKEFLWPLVTMFEFFFLIFAVGAGSAVQFFWYPGIAKIFLTNLQALLTGGSADAHKEDIEASENPGKSIMVERDSDSDSEESTSVP